MLRVLATAPGETVPRGALTGNGSVNERAVDVQINPLRRKIERDPANPLFLQAVRGIGYRLVASIIELLFFAYRDFVGDADNELEAFGFGRAHHRVLHFVFRYPGLKVADLLDVLRITKQSLGRVLKQLLDEGYIVQKTGNNDRRQRLLYSERRRARRWSASSPACRPSASTARWSEIGLADAKTVRRFLRAMINHNDPDKVLETIFRAVAAKE